VTRVASLLPSVTEILFAIGAGDRVVGVTHECDFPPQARGLPVLTASMLPAELQTHLGAAQTGAAVAERAAKIDRHVRANVHSGSSLYALDDVLLAKLEPDVIITQELCEVCAVSYELVAQAAKRLRGDPRVVSLEPSSLDDVYANIITVGELTDTEPQARALVERLKERIRELQKRTSAKAPRRTLILEWTDPPMSGGHWTPGLVEIAGGTPILSNPGKNSQRVEWDAIAAADPDVIIVAPCGYDLAHGRAAVAELASNPIWSGLRAVRTGRAYLIDGNAYVNRPGPRLVDSAELFSYAIAGIPGPPDAIESIVCA
jgi:iron complex transport system substrate-binding protein